MTFSPWCIREMTRASLATDPSWSGVTSPVLPAPMPTPRAGTAPHTPPVASTAPGPVSLVGSRAVCGVESINPATSSAKRVARRDSVVLFVGGIGPASVG